MTRILAFLRDFLRIPELAPDDPDGLSDREREELRIIRDHQEGHWE